MELKSIKRNLAVPNGNDEHDTSENLKLERKLRSWLQHTSLVNIIKWRAKLTATSIHHGKKEYLWQPDTIKRDKLFLEKIGIKTGALFMFGFPEQTEAELSEDINILNMEREINLRIKSHRVF